MSPTAAERQRSRDAFLAAVTEITEANVDNWTDLRQIGAAMGLEGDELEATARFLRERHLVRFESDHGGFIGPISVTVPGILEVERKGLSSGSGSGARELLVLLFTDIVKSTDLAAELGDVKWAKLLRDHQAMVRQKINQSGGREIDAAGDGFFAVFPLSTTALACALNIRNTSRASGIEIRCGLHAGEVQRDGVQVSGLAVHAASRVMNHAEPNEVLASSTVRELAIGAAAQFTDRGLRELRGVEPSQWRLFAVSPRA